MLIFAIVCIISAGITLGVAVMTKGIVSEGRNSDADKQIYAASRVEEWVWPSDMHKYANIKARMKDVGVLLLVLTQRLLNDRKGFYPVVIVCNAANSLCAVLIFLVAEAYWTTEVGLLLFALFVTCFWPYLVVLQGGYQGLAVALFLLSGYFLRQAEMAALPYGGLWYLASGVVFGLMLFSSASAKKLIPLYFGALLFSQRSLIEPLWFVVPRSSVWSGLALVTAGAMSALFLFLCLIPVTYKHVIKFIYYGRGPARLNSLFSNRGKNSLEHYFEIVKPHINRLIWAILAVESFLLFCLLFFRSNSFYSAMLFSALGTIGISVLLLYPDIWRNLQGYWTYWTMSLWGDHFPQYDGYFTKHYGKTVRLGRGELQWIMRIFWRMAPFHSLYFILSVLFLGYVVYLRDFDTREIATAFLIVVLGVSPLIWSEITKGPKAALTYFPVFAGLFLVIGYGGFVAEESLSDGGRMWFWIAAFCVVVAGAAWNTWIFFDDIWPSRMATAWLAKSLASLGVSNLYSYDTLYNKPWLDALPDGVRNRYTIRYVKTLAEVAQGYVVVPPTSSKSANFQSSAVGYAGDFDEDPLLDELINSRSIVRYSVASFKTFGTSRFWAQIGNVTSYRDLMLGEVTDRDRWRGMAWIVDAGKLHGDLMAKQAGQQRGLSRTGAAPEEALFERTP